MGFLYQIRHPFGALLDTQQGSVHAEVVGRSFPPGLVRVEIVVRGTRFVRPFNQMLGFRFRDPGFLAKVVDPEIHRGMDEDIETSRIVAQDIVRATPHENTVVFFGQT